MRKKTSGKDQTKTRKKKVLDLPVKKVKGGSIKGGGFKYEHVK